MGAHVSADAGRSARKKSGIVGMTGVCEIISWSWFGWRSNVGHVDTAWLSRLLFLHDTTDRPQPAVISHKVVILDAEFVFAAFEPDGNTHGFHK